MADLQWETDANEEMRRAKALFMLLEPPSFLTHQEDPWWRLAANKQWIAPPDRLSIFKLPMIAPIAMQWPMDRVVVGDGGGNLWIVELPIGQVEAIDLGGGGNISSLSLSDNAAFVSLEKGASCIRHYDGTLVGGLVDIGSEVVSASNIQGSNSFIFADATGNLRIIDETGCRNVGKLALMPCSMLSMRDGKVTVASNSQHRGHLIASLCADNNYEIEWSTPGSRGTIKAVALSSDAQWVVTGETGQCRVIEGDTGQVIHTLKMPLGDVNAISINPASTYFVVAGRGGAFLRLYDLHSGELLYYYPRGIRPVELLSWNEQGNSFASVDALGNIELWPAIISDQD